MKQKHLFPFVLLLLFVLPMRAQTFNSQYTYISGSNCISDGTNYYMSFFLECPSCIPFQDSVSVVIDYGDGSPLDSVKDVVYPPYPNYYNFPYGYLSRSHNYPAVTASYDVTAIAVFPGNIRDTVVYTDAAWLNASCNTLSGQIYRDNNNNCIFDAGDVPSPVIGVRLWSGSPVSYSLIATDANGFYNATVVSGVNYTITPDINNYGYTASAPVSCSINDSVSFMAASTNQVNFPLTDSDEFLSITITDSAAGLCFNSNNGFSLLRGSYIFYSDISTPVVNAQVFFGDGDDTTFSVYNWNQSTLFHSGLFYVNHQYPGPGSYNVQVILSESVTGVIDTFFAQNEVIFLDSCGSLSGYLYDDSDNSCTYTSGEGIPIIASIAAYQNNILYAIDYVDMYGYYNLDLPPGNYTIDVNSYITTYGYTMACSQPSSIAMNIPPNVNTAYDFGFECNTSLFDMSAWISGGFFRPATQSTIYPGAFSQNCNTGSGTVTLILDPLVSFVGSCDSSFTPTVNGNVLTWPYSTAQIYNWWQSWNCLYLLTDSSAQIGDSVCFTLYLSPNTPDNNPQNDTVYICFPIRNSYDPNMKEVRVPDMFANGDVLNNRTHEYTVYFQNTGNDVAFDIFILDTLDSDLNPATLQIIGSSHPMEVDYLNGDVLKFDFKNINLPDSFSNEPQSHGWVKYTIAQDANLSPGTLIENTAYIFFDINPAIITNTTVNTIVNPTGIAEQVNLPVQVYPVPASSELQLRFGSDISGTITLINTLGQSVHTQSLNGNAASIDVRSLPAGVYQLQVLTANGVVNRSVVIQR